MDDMQLSLFDEEEIVDFEVEDFVKRGYIYILGDHRLMCGDSCSDNDVKQLMDGNVAQCVFTDPPYSYNYQSGMRNKNDRFDVILNDDKMLDFMPMVKKYSDGWVFVCTTWKVVDVWLEYFKKFYELSNMIIWYKRGGGIGDLTHTFSTDYEIILCSNNDKTITGKRLGSVWEITKDNPNDYIHPTQKPVKLSETAIKNTTNRNDIILDLFGGSGSTLMACEQLHRKCYMMELDTHYASVIITRWEKATGKKAILINGDE